MRLFTFLAYRGPDVLADRRPLHDMGIGEDFFWHHFYQTTAESTNMARLSSYIVGSETRPIGAVLVWADSNSEVL